VRGGAATATRPTIQTLLQSDKRAQLDRASRRAARYDATVEAAVEQVRRDVVTACRVLLAAGQADMVWGHVSIRDPLGRGLWLKGSNLGFDELDEEGLILLSLEGEVLEGSAGRHLEYPIHTELMARRPDVNAVVHTHPLYSIAFASTGWPLRALSHEATHFVPPDIARFTKTGDLVRTRELGQALAETLGDRLGVLMPHHGITTVGRDVGEAVAAATHLERACQIALLAGPDAEGSPDAEALAKRERSARHLAMAWAYLARTVDR
jgi:L-ribulose-5-phosphate 4-epimerase